MADRYIVGNDGSQNVHQIIMKRRNNHEAKNEQIKVSANESKGAKKFDKRQSARITFDRLAEDFSAHRGDISIDEKKVVGCSKIFLAQINRLSALFAVKLGSKLRKIGVKYGPWSLLFDDFVALLQLLIFISCVHLYSLFSVITILVGVFTFISVKRVLPRTSSFFDIIGGKRKPRLKVVCISDTHGAHRELTTSDSNSNLLLPDGDVLIHAGDYTRFGNEEDARDFNAWLGELKTDLGYNFKEIVVVNGNHEANTKVRRSSSTILHRKAALANDSEQENDNREKVRDNDFLPLDSLITNARLLKDQTITICNNLKVHGCNFSWPISRGDSSVETLYDNIDRSTDIIIAHSPAKGFVDGQRGCTTLLETAARVKPLLLVSGHIHHAHGVRDGIGVCRDVKFVNAANAGGGLGEGGEIGHGMSVGGKRLGWPPVIVEL